MVSLLVLLSVASLLPSLTLGNSGPVRSQQEPEFEKCHETVSSWAEAAFHSLPSPNQTLNQELGNLRDLLFFLNVPRSGGSDFHRCLLLPLFALEPCPQSYDEITLDRSVRECRLLATLDDDYSLLDQLPPGTTSVVTSLREPVDRVLSSYEFWTKIAAHNALEKQHHGETTPTTSDSNSFPFAAATRLWPWKYLVPMLEQDLLAHRDDRGVGAAIAILNNNNDNNITTSGTSVSNDWWEGPEGAMPLREFIGHPVAHELLHNGATFQVAGLTNNSKFGNATAVRSCVAAWPRLGERVLAVAKARLDAMLYVGLADRQEEATLFFARLLMAGQVSTEPFWRRVWNRKNSKRETREPSSSSKHLEAHQIANFTELDELTNEDVEDEMSRCLFDGPGALFERKQYDELFSVDREFFIDFSWQRRKRIPQTLMDEVARLNALDRELYAHAQFLVERRPRIFSRKTEIPFQEFRKFDSLDSVHRYASWLSVPVFAVVVNLTGMVVVGVRFYLLVK